MLSMSTHNSHKLLEKTLSDCTKRDHSTMVILQHNRFECSPREHFLGCGWKSLLRVITLSQLRLKKAELELWTCRLVTSAEACVHGLSTTQWGLQMGSHPQLVRDSLAAPSWAEKWPIILKIAQCLEIPIANAQKNSSIIYLGLVIWA